VQRFVDETLHDQRSMNETLHRMLPGAVAVRGSRRRR
jgi:hypothetical protein